MDSRFWDVYRDIRSLIQKPDDALYMLHTSIGIITVRKFVFRPEAGYVFLQGTDENGRERTAGFTEQLFTTFALEIQTKSPADNGQIKFNPNVVESLQS
ncbi:MAG: hypothetical protein WCA10_09125 [Terracidiphilus sp.]